MNFVIKLKKFLEQRSFLILLLGIIIYTAVFSFLTLKKLDYFAYNNFDLAIFNQVFFNTIHGRWFEMTVNLNNYLADHFTPFVFVLLPFYALKPGPGTLLVMQSFILALAALPLYLVSYKVTSHKLLSLGLAFAWLCNPFVQQVNFSEFHAEVVMAFLFFVIFYFYYTKKFKYFLLFFVLTLLVREDMALFLFGFPLLAIADKRNWRWIFVPIILSISYFLFAIQMINHFSIFKQYKFFIYYAWLGGTDAWSILWSFISHPWQVIKHILALDTIFSSLVVLWPFLFLPLYQARYLFLAALPFVMVLLTGSGFTSLVYSTHYILYILPGLFIATIFALQSLRTHKYYGHILILLVVTTIYLAIFLAPVKNFVNYQFDQDKIAYKKLLVSQIPSDAKVAASSDFLPIFSNRQYIYPLGYAFFGYAQFLLEPFILPQVDYILIDFEDFMVDIVSKEGRSFLAQHKEQMNDNWRLILEQYTLVEVRSDIFLFQKKTPEQAGLFLADVVEFKGDRNQQSMLLDYQFLPDDNVLEILVDTNLFIENAIIRFYYDNKYFNLPLDYALFSKKFLAPDKAIKVHYYLPEKVNSFQLFSWQGDNKVSLINNATPVLTVQKLSDKISL